MKTYRMSIYLGSTLLMHECFSIYDIVCSMRDLMAKIPEFEETFNDQGAMDKFISELVKLQDGVSDHYQMTTPYLRIETED